MTPEPMALDLLLDDEPEAQSGLGRGLAAILADSAAEPERTGGLASLIPTDLPPSRGNSPAPAPGIASASVPEALEDDLVRALLDGLGSSVPLDLCAYLHQAERGPARLHLRSPSLATFTPADAFDLFRLLDRRLRSGRSSDLEVAGHHGRIFATRGDHSRGVYAVGRRRGSLGEREYDAVEAFCRASGSALHQLADAPANPPLETHLHVVDVALGAEATVDLRPADRPATRGQAWAQSRVGAIAGAVVEAVGGSASFRYGGEVAVEDGRVALVLLDHDGTVALRAGHVADGVVGSAVAVAAYAAALTLQP
jgi:hypothetical protein